MPMIFSKELEECDFTNSWLSDAWKENKGRFIDPQQLIVRAFKTNQNIDENIQKKLIAYTFKKDPFSGVYTQTLGNFVSGIAEEYARQTKRNDIGIIEIDFENNKRAIKLLGLNRMKKITRAVIGILQEEMNTENAKFTFPARTNVNGDEFRLVFVGVEENNVKLALNRFRERTEKLFNEIGLSNIIHPKYPETPERNGISVGAGFALLNGKHNTYSDILDKFDRGIELDKINRGIDRHKHNGKGGFDITPIQIPLIKKQFDEVMDRAEYSRFHDFKIHNEDFPIQLQVHKEFIPNCDKIMATLDNIKIPKIIKKLSSHRDPLTGFYQLSELVPDLNKFIQYTSTSNKVGHLVDFELRNLPGMNDLLGSESTDVVIKHTANIVRTVLNAELGNEHYFAYTTFGSRFKILALDVPTEKLDYAMKQVVELVEKDINKVNVKEFLNGKAYNERTKKIPDQLKFGDIGNTYFKGDSGITSHYSIAGINQSISAEQNLKKLEDNFYPQIRQGLWDEELSIRRG